MKMGAKDKTGSLATWQRFLRMVAMAVLFVAGATPAHAVPLEYFPRDIRRANNYLREYLSPDFVQQEEIAVGKLTPDRADRDIASLRAELKTVPPSVLLAEWRELDQLRATLPPASQQVFVDGLFEVSPSETAFAQETVERRITEVLVAGASADGLERASNALPQ